MSRLGALFAWLRRAAADLTGNMPPAEVRRRLKALVEKGAP